MQVSPKTTIREIQTSFNKTFPGLKIEFFKDSHEIGQGSSNENKLAEDTEIIDLNPTFSEKNLVIAPSISVADLETNLRDMFGVSAQVYRRSNELWLQTISTDHWTLELQNRKGIHSIN